MSDTRQAETPQRQVARAVAVCAGVAELWLRYGGSTMKLEVFHFSDPVWQDITIVAPTIGKEASR